jgi:uncharacterized protein YgbK (DUF1537 family)
MAHTPTTATKIIALDDDPTGSQTVHGCLLLTRWDVATLRRALRDASPIFFVLTNTRGMDAERAAAITREVCRKLKRALAEEASDGHSIQPILVSRSDSTLRGHYPVETDVIAEELGPFDAHFLVPAFVEAGRITRDSVHYVVQDDRRIPAHETEFARDSVFAYRHSYLPDYVQEKTGGRIKADAVERILIEDLDETLAGRLATMSGNTCVVVDAETQGDLDRFAEAVRRAAARGARFLFRSAASLLTALAGLPPQPVPREAMRSYVREGAPGAVIVGSHVRKTTEQLERLLTEPGTVAIEVDVNRLPEERDAVLDEASAAIARAHAAGQTPVVYTSRSERRFPDQQTRLAFGEQVSALLMDIERALPSTIGYLISKGGITSNDTLSTGLELASARVLGQILTGCSVVRCPQDHPRFPDLPVVIFPGNVGGDESLAEAYRRLAGPEQTTARRAAG